MLLEMYSKLSNWTEISSYLKVCPAKLAVVISCIYHVSPVYDSNAFHTFSVHTWTYNFDIACDIVIKSM